MIPTPSTLSILPQPHQMKHVPYKNIWSLLGAHPSIHPFKLGYLFVFFCLFCLLRWDILDYESLGRVLNIVGKSLARRGAQALLCAV